MKPQVGQKKHQKSAVSGKKMRSVHHYVNLLL